MTIDKYSGFKRPRQQFLRIDMENKVYYKSLSGNVGIYFFIYLLFCFYIELWFYFGTLLSMHFLCAILHIITIYDINSTQRIPAKQIFFI